MNIRNFTWLIPIVVLAGIFGGCEDKGDVVEAVLQKSTPKPVNRGVTVEPGIVGLGKGFSQKFTATVTGSGDKTLTWSVAGGIEGTTVDNAGVLTVDAAETAKMLTVMAALSADKGRYGTAVVQIIGNEDIPEANGLRVTPQTIMLAPGDTQSFSAYFTADDAKAVVKAWTVDSQSGSGFTGNALTVAAGENAEKLTVTGSLEDGKYGAAIVTVLGNAVDPVPVNNGVCVSPQTSSVGKGKSIEFEAYSGTDGSKISGGLSWQLLGGASGTKISTGGKLDVAADESAGYLTVRAKGGNGSYGTAVVAVSDHSGENKEPGSAVELSFKSLTANGTANNTGTTELTLVFSEAISGLEAGDIAISPAAALTKGTLSGGNGGTYKLGVNRISAETEITVSVSKSGYVITPASKTVTVHKFIVPVMIQLPGGSFVRDDGKTVKVSSFQIGKYEVTQKEWDALMIDLKRRNDWRFNKGKDDDNPMYLINWYEAVKYCNMLSESQGLDPAYIIGSGSTPSVTCDFTKNGYRLPTEAEWEYAARGGENYKYSGSNDLDAVAWHGDNSSRKTHPVGQKKPNGYGLYDMNGNVWEWCWDWYGTYSTTELTDPTGSISGNSRINRGADWWRSASNTGNGDDAENAKDFELGFRHGDAPNIVWDTIGFRVVRRP